MDKTKISFSDKEPPIKLASIESETENLHILSQELDTFNENSVPGAEFAQKLKHISDEKKDDPDKRLKIKKDQTLQEGTFQVSLKVNCEEYAKSMKHQKTEKIPYSSVKNAKNIRRMALKYLRRAKRNPTGTKRNIRLIKRKYKIRKVFKSNLTDGKLEKDDKFISKMSEYREIFEEEFWLEMSRLEGLEASMSVLTNNVKENTKGFMPSNVDIQSETSEDASLPSCSTHYTFPSFTQYDDVSETQASYDRSAKEVLEHFRLFMKSRVESSDRSNTHINKEDINRSPESEICSLEDTEKVLSESVYQDLEDTAKTTEFAQDTAKTTEFAQDTAKTTEFVQDTAKITEFAKDSGDSTKTILKCAGKGLLESEMTQNSEKGINADNCANVIKNTRKISRQRIVYNERDEGVRGWLIQLIKDRNILLKLRIMEGKYTKDMETKMRCIERANDLQDETDSLIDILDDHEKMGNFPKRFKGSSNAIQKDVSKSATGSENGFKWSERRIKCFASLFLYLYKSPKSEDEKVFERIHPRKLVSALDAYLVLKKKHDRERNGSELVAKRVVDKLYMSLEICRSNAKRKIAYIENETLEDYQNYINDLTLAVNANFNCLSTLISPATSVILPLISYLSQSRNQFIEIVAFLQEKRSDVFLKKTREN